MITSFIAIVAVIAICLSFETTRGLGIAGVLLLMYVFPFITAAALTLVGGSYYFYKHYR
jgi:hypothetical protein